MSKTLSYVKYCLSQVLSQLLTFYNTHIDQPRVKKLNNVELLKELPFYDELSIVRNKTAFSGYAQSYKIEIVD